MSQLPLAGRPAGAPAAGGRRLGPGALSGLLAGAHEAGAARRGVFGVLLWGGQVSSPELAPLWSLCFPLTRQQYLFFCWGPRFGVLL